MPKVVKRSDGSPLARLEAATRRVIHFEGVVANLSPSRSRDFWLGKLERAKIDQLYWSGLCQQNPKPNAST